MGDDAEAAPAAPEGEAAAPEAAPAGDTPAVAGDAAAAAPAEPAAAAAAPAEGAPAAAADGAEAGGDDAYADDAEGGDEDYFPGEDEGGAVTASSSQVRDIDEEPVTPEEVRAFRTSMSARRFPALRELKDEDIVQLVMADRRTRLKARAARQGPSALQAYRTKVLSSPNLAHLAFSPAASRDADMSAEMRRRPPFSPVNPSLARTDIQRRGPTAYVSIHSPYEMDKVSFLTMKASDEADRGMAPFCPSGMSGAAERIEVNYFLNSADAETLAAEKSHVRAVALRESQTFMGTFERGQGFPKAAHSTGSGGRGSDRY